MSDAKQTADELFPVEKQTAEELFPTARGWAGTEPEAALNGPTYDKIFSEGPLGQILQKFGVGAKKGLGMGTPGGLDIKPPDGGESAAEYLKRIGYFSDLEKGQQGIAGEFTEWFMRRAALDLDIAFNRLPSAVVSGIGEVAPGLAAGIEAFPGGHFTGFPHGVVTDVGMAAVDLAQRAHSRQQLHEFLDEASKLSIIGDRPTGTIAREALAPDVRPPESPAEPFVPDESFMSFTAPAPADIHQTVRLIAPDVMKRYDALSDQRTELEGLVEDAGKNYNIGDRAVSGSARQFDVERAAEEPLPEGYEKHVRAVQAELRALDRKMQELAPEVTEAYKEAGRLQAAEAVTGEPTAKIPPMNLVPGIPPVAPGFTRFFHGGDLSPTRGGGRWVDTNAEYAANYRRTSAGRTSVWYVDIPKGDPIEVAARKWDFVDEQAGTNAVGAYRSIEVPEEWAKKMQLYSPGDTPASGARARGETVPGEPAPSATPEIQTPSQPVPSIAQDVARQLRAAGRPDDEARVYGALQAAYYQTRAERFGGALGAAQDLYAEQAPRIVRDARGGRRGSFIISKNLLKLFRDADASSYLHEMGHKYLLDMQKDSTHPAATAEFLADWQLVQNWLRVRKGLTEGQQEKFARGIERYFLEGQAPIPKLAGVFEKVRQFMARVYQYSSQLRVPLNDDIRGVFDRLFAKPNDEPVIAPEYEGAEDFAAAHERSAREAPADEAEAAANAVRLERDQVGGDALSRETDSGRLDARRGPERVVVPEESGTGGESAERRAPLAPEDAPIDTGRDPPKTKSEAPASAHDQFNPIGTGLTDGHGNVRLANLWVAEDIAEAIRGAVHEANGFAASRRTPMTDADMLIAADATGMRVEDLLKRRVGEAWSGEEITAGLKLMRESEADLRDAMARAETGDVQGIVDEAIARERHLLIVESLTMAASEAGRALRALREIRKLSDPKLINELLQRTLGKDLKQLQLESKLGLYLDTPAQLNKFLRDATKATTSDMLIEAWVNGLLSGPYTHIRNMVGNSAVVINDLAETGLAALISKIRGSNAVQFAEVRDRWEGLIQGAQEGMIAFGKAIRDEGFSDTSQVEMRRRRAIPDEVFGVNIRLGQAIRLPGRFLEAEDQIFKAIARRQQLNVLARRWTTAAIEAGQIPESSRLSHIAELLRAPSEEMLAAADDHALYQTFQNELGPVGNSIMAFANSHPLARIIVPFVRTPTNILSYAVERTPFGLASRRIRANLMGRNGEVMKDTQIARLVLGTTFMTAIGALTYNGLLTGGGPPNPDDMHTWRQTGRIPYAVRIRNTWVSYANFDPISIQTGIAADLVDIAHAGFVEGKEFDKLAVMAATLFARDVLEKFSFRGASQVVQVATDPAQYGPQFFQQLAASTVPAIAGQAAQQLDPFAREVRNATNGWKAVGNAMKARMPGLREELPLKYDNWGNPITEHNFGPVQYSAASHDPVSLEVDRLGMSLAYPQHEMENVPLTPTQYADYTRESGRLAHMMIEKMIEDPRWSTIPDGMKKQLIHEDIESARHDAGEKLKIESMLTPHNIPAQALEKRRETMR